MKEIAGTEERVCDAYLINRGRDSLVKVKLVILVTE